MGIFGNFLERGLHKLGSIGKDISESKYAKNLKAIGNTLVEKVNPQDILKPIIQGFEGKKI